MLSRFFSFALLFVIPVLAGAQSLPTKECGITALQVCAVHIAQDELGIVTSPLHASKADLLWIAPFGVATGVALDTDARALRAVGHNPGREDKFGKVSDYGGVFAPIAAIGAGYVAGAVTHNDYLRRTAMLAGEAMADATILGQGLKYAINRQTPSQGDATGRFWLHGTKSFPDGQSMPSGHSINVWAFAHVVAAQYSGWGTRLVVYSLATTVSGSRVMARDHFPSDVLVGGVFGYLIGGYVVHHRADEDIRLSFAPVRTPNGQGIQVSYNFKH